VTSLAAVNRNLAFHTCDLRELLNGVRSLRGDERKLDRQIVEYICEIETRRLYAEIGYPNIIEWLVKDLGYSESIVYWQPIDG
jgi:hypothetical protein